MTEPGPDARARGFADHPFAERRRTVLSHLADGSMLLPASPVRFKNADSQYRYRPGSELFYLTGWELPECIALLRGFADEDRFVLFATEPDPAKELWTGKRLPLAEAKERFGACAVHPLSQFSARAPELLAGGDRVLYRLGESDVCDRAVRRALGKGRGLWARRGAGLRTVADPGTVLDDMRVRKDAGELARIGEAARITVEAFREGLARVADGVGEWEVEAALEAGFRRRGAQGPAFATIIAAGSAACTLHYAANDRRMRAGQLVVADAGAEVGWYGADVTRTAPVSGRMGGLQREAWGVVRRAQAAAVAVCGPGVDAADVHRAAVAEVAQGLVELGVLPGPVRQVLEQKAYQPFFPHNTSHWLGLDTHDPGVYGTLAPSMVLTVEPGLYFRPGTCPRRPALEGTGIRIEDDVLVTQDGARVLTADLPVDPELPDAPDLSGAPPGTPPNAPSPDAPSPDAPTSPDAG